MSSARMHLSSPRLQSFYSLQDLVIEAMAEIQAGLRYSPNAAAQSVLDLPRPASANAGSESRIFSYLEAAIQPVLFRLVLSGLNGQHKSAEAMTIEVKACWPQTSFVMTYSAVGARWWI